MENGRDMAISVFGLRSTFNEGSVVYVGIPHLTYLLNPPRPSIGGSHLVVAVVVCCLFVCLFVCFPLEGKCNWCKFWSLLAS